MLRKLFDALFRRNQPAPWLSTVKSEQKVTENELVDLNRT